MLPQDPPLTAKVMGAPFTGTPRDVVARTEMVAVDPSPGRYCGEAEIATSSGG